MTATVNWWDCDENIDVVLTYTIIFCIIIANNAYILFDFSMDRSISFSTISDKQADLFAQIVKRIERVYSQTFSYNSNLVQSN